MILAEWYVWLPLISKLNSTLMSELNVSLVTELAMGSIVKERG